MGLGIKATPYCITCTSLWWWGRVQTETVKHEHTSCYMSYIHKLHTYIIHIYVYNHKISKYYFSSLKHQLPKTRAIFRNSHPLSFKQWALLDSVASVSSRPAWSTNWVWGLLGLEKNPVLKPPPTKRRKLMKPLNGFHFFSMVKTL